MRRSFALSPDRSAPNCDSAAGAFCFARWNKFGLIEGGDWKSAATELVEVEFRSAISRSFAKFYAIFRRRHCRDFYRLESGR